MDTMLLVLIILVISVLLYIRTRIVERMRREQLERAARAQRQRQDGDQAPRPIQDDNRENGLPPGDPARAEWAILR